MHRDDTRPGLELLLAAGVVAVLRGESADSVLETGVTLLEAGICALEVTMTVPSALDVMSRLAGETTAVVGAGSVRTAADVDACVDAGALYIVSPVCRREVIDRARIRGAIVIPGAMTPTEVLTAWDWGADLVKVFPAGRLGPAYLKDLHGPMPEIPLVPTGGITGENAGEYFEAGAALVCLGSWLTNGDSAQVRQRAKMIVGVLNTHKRRSAADVN
jgi:2-dehydro-3-deoxyphosphogluconate aldolase/(4S)-4-hydroxy-2-oxoglutarate aldolase